MFKDATKVNSSPKYNQEISINHNKMILIYGSPQHLQDMDNLQELLETMDSLPNSNNKIMLGNSQEDNLNNSKESLQ